MDVTDALRVLGLSDAPDWSDVRAAHRRAIVRTHPDAGGSPGDAARVNQAFDLLRKISGNGERPIPGGAPAPPTAPVPGSRSTSPEQLIADDDPVELLLRMADAAHEIGEVVFVDPNDGLLEVIVGDPPGVGQLTATVDEATLHRPVYSIASFDLVTIDHDATLLEATALMLERRISCLPVRAATGNIAGVVTKTDLLRATISCLVDQRPADAA